MKKELARKLHNNRQTVEAYACSCSCSCSCTCNCSVAGSSYTYNIYNSNKNSEYHNREESSVLSRIA